MSVSVAWRCRLYHIIMPHSSHTLWLNTAPQDSLLSLVTQHSLDQIQLSPSLLISSHSGNPLVVGVLLRLCLFQYTQIHTQMEKRLFHKRWCIKVTHRLEVDFSLSRKKKRKEFRTEGFNFCLWLWNRGSEQRRKRKTKISGPLCVAQSSGGNNANDSSENITLLPACAHADAMVNVCLSGNKDTNVAHRPNVHQNQLLLFWNARLDSVVHYQSEELVSPRMWDGRWLWKKRHFGVCVLITNTAGHKADAHVLMKIIHRSSHLSGCGP